MTTVDLAGELETLRPMIVGLARGFLGRGLDLDDLTGVAWLAACESARNFEPGGPASLRTYLSRRVRYALIDATRDGGLIRVPRRYHGPSGAALTGPAAVAAHDMLSRRVIGEAALGEVRLSDLAIARIDFSPEEEPMSATNRVNGFIDHSAPAELPAPDRCHECSEPYRVAGRTRCYNRSCPRSGYTQDKAKAVEVPKPKAKAARPAVPAPPATAVSLADEIRVMAALAELPPSSLARVLNWATAALTA